MHCNLSSACDKPQGSWYLPKSKQTCEELYQNALRLTREIECMVIFLDHLINKLALEEEILDFIIGPTYFHPEPSGRYLTSSG